jgi:hypothetical protein
LGENLQGNHGGKRDEISRRGYGTQGFGWDVSSTDLNKEKKVTG